MALLSQFSIGNTIAELVADWYAGSVAARAVFCHSLTTILLLEYAMIVIKQTAVILKITFEMLCSLVCSYFLAASLYMYIVLRLY